MKEQVDFQRDEDDVHFILDIFIVLAILNHSKEMRMMFTLY